MFLTPKEVDQVLREVRNSYLKLRNDAHPHNQKVGLYGLLAISKVQEGLVKKLKEKGKENPPRFF
jgi:hypothetical protein